MHFWRDKAGPEGDPWQFARDRQLARLENGETIVVADEGEGAVAVMIAAALPTEPQPPDHTSDDMRPMTELENLVPGSWNLLIFATSPEHQRRGHGAALMRAFEDIGREKGHDTASLIVFDPNPPAWRCYSKSGFRENARRPVRQSGATAGHWADHWVLMTKSLF